MAKMAILFDGFDWLAEQLDEKGGDLKKAVNEALNESQKIVQQNLATGAGSYARKGGGMRGYATGKMYGTIINNPEVVWRGNIAEVGVGFDLSQRDGKHSIFVMHGTAKMDKDQKVYNAVMGSRTRKQIAKKQEEVMQKYLSLGGGGNG